MSAADLIARTAHPHGTRMHQHHVCEALRSGHFPESLGADSETLFSRTSVELLIRAVNECGAEVATLGRLYGQHLEAGSNRNAEIEHLLKRWGGDTSALLPAPPRRPGQWKPLLRQAIFVIGDVERRLDRGNIEAVLGGGARLVHALGHRETGNIDLFLGKASDLRVLSAAFEAWQGSGENQVEESSRLTVLLPEGEIRFVVAPRLLELAPPVFDDTLQVYLEDTREVIAKKLFYRGATLTVADLFDWRATAELATDIGSERALAALVGARADDIGKSLDRIEASGFDRREWHAMGSQTNLSLGETVGWARRELNKLATLSGR